MKHLQPLWLLNWRFPFYIFRYVVVVATIAVMFYDVGDGTRKLIVRMVKISVQHLLKIVFSNFIFILWPNFAQTILAYWQLLSADLASKYNKKQKFWRNHLQKGDSLLFFLSPFWIAFSVFFGLYLCIYLSIFLNTILLPTLFLSGLFAFFLSSTQALLSIYHCTCATACLLAVIFVCI